MWHFNMDRFSLMIELWQQTHGMSIQDLSDLSGIAVSSLYALKKGQYAPSMAQLTAVCNATSFSPESFFKKEVGTKNGK